MTAKPFWQTKSLSDLSHAQWEALCDGCGKCCLNKLEQADGGDMLFTRIACRLLDTEQGRCSNYSERAKHVDDCVELSAENIAGLSWLPDSCAYRLLYEGKPLYEWHPLISGSPSSVHEAGMSVVGRVISEEYVHPDSLEEHIIQWV